MLGVPGVRVTWCEGYLKGGGYLVVGVPGVGATCCEGYLLWGVPAVRGHGVRGT